MDPRFIPYVEHLHPKMQALISMAPVTPMSLPSVMCKKGVYLHFRKKRSISTWGVAMTLGKDFRATPGQALPIAWQLLRFGWLAKQRAI